MRRVNRAVQQRQLHHTWRRQLLASDVTAWWYALRCSESWMGSWSLHPASKQLVSLHWGRGQRPSNRTRASRRPRCMLHICWRMAFCVPTNPIYEPRKYRTLFWMTIIVLEVGNIFV